MGSSIGSLKQSKRAATGRSGGTTKTAPRPPGAGPRNGAGAGGAGARYIPMLDVNVSANAIKKYESVKHKKNWWVHVKNQIKKDSLWLIYEMLERKDTFFREMPNNEANMATLHYGSKKHLEYEGSTFDAPVLSPEKMQKANDDRKSKIIKKTYHAL